MTIDFGHFVHGLSKGFNELSKNLIYPTVGDVGNTLAQFGPEKLAPALGEAGEALEHSN